MAKLSHLPLSHTLAAAATQATKPKAEPSRGRVDVGASLNRQAPKTQHSAPADRPDMRVDPDGSSIWLSVFDVDFYDRNPRTQRNPQYEEIKASMIDRVAEADRTGQDIQPISQPVKVTLRPNGRYVLAGGGNTRLEIQRELYTETKNPRYRMAHFIFTPYRGEAQILAEHWLENEIRSGTCFWDKAKAMAMFRADFAAEFGTSISLRALEERLQEKGIRVSKTVLQQYLFAADNLQSLGQAAYGLSQYTIRRLLPLYNLVAELAKLSGDSQEAIGRLLHDTLVNIEHRYAEHGELTMEIIEAGFDQTARARWQRTLSELETIDEARKRGSPAEALRALAAGDAPESPEGAGTTLPCDQEASPAPRRRRTTTTAAAPSERFRGAAAALLQTVDLPITAVRQDGDALQLDHEQVAGQIDSAPRSAVWWLVERLADPDSPMARQIIDLFVAATSLERSAPGK